MHADDASLALACRWPAEWEPHAATWIAWPHNQATWPQRFAPIPGCFADIIRTLARYEPVHVLSGGKSVMSEARAMVGRLPNVTLHDIPTNDVWIRDYGPTFLQGPAAGEVSLIDWQFNSWGEKYAAWDLDNAVPQRIAERFALRRFAPGIVMEGGSIDGNGAGLVMTSESCLLQPQRNPGLSRQEIEKLLLRYLGASRIIWLAGGPVAGDDTDGHIDQLARFVSPTKIVLAVEDDPCDVNYQALRTNLRMLDMCRHEGPTTLEIIPLPMPRPIYVEEQRVPASYCNFYIANGCVLVPMFDDPADEQACSILRSLFDDREIVGLPARDLIWGLGALHCMTQQQPKEPLAT